VEERLIYRRQFVAGPCLVETFRGWDTEEFGEGFYVSIHPELCRARVATGNKEGLCLGDILDPEHPELGNEHVLTRVLDAGENFEQLERATRGLGGRWLVLLRVGQEVRLYPDAGGTRSVFFSEPKEHGGVWVGSQPGLLAALLGLKVDGKLRDRFLGAQYAHSWPMEVTPYRGVRRLTPNHFLDLRTGVACRFWPSEALPRLEVDIAVRLTSRLLHGILASITRRGRVAMPLTGGYDSRVLLSCARKLRAEMEFFTIVVPTTPYYESAIPQRIGKRLGFDVKTLVAEAVDPSFREICRQNVSDMYWERGMILYYAFGHHFPDAVVLSGGLAEIGRCFYYPDGCHPDVVTAEALAVISGYEGNRVAIESFAKWLADVQLRNIALLDLFYWEHRIGNWFSLACTELDTICEVVAPYNCRRLLEALLSVDVAFRRSPYAFFRRICEVEEPALANIPFNESWRDAMAETIGNIVPWRVQNWFRKLRFRAVGLDPEAVG
jgi:hypothetical protein